MTPGIHTIPMADYIADPCAGPSLSGGLAHTLLTRSPLHAWHAHPRLNPGWQPSDPTPEQDEGTALHAAILENENLVEVLEFSDFRTKEARAARDAARKAGRIPIKRDRWEEIRSVGQAMRKQLAGHECADILEDGRPEQTMIWQWQDVWVRNRVDWMPNDPRGWLTDIKTVAVTAEPEAFGRKLVTEGYALSAAVYLEGARALGRRPAGYRWLVLERDPPHGLSVVAMAPDMMHLAEQQARRALEMWRECLRSNQWPSYPPHTCYIEAPAWASMQWEARVERDRTAPARPFHMPEDARVMRSGMPFA
jgi:hypothetical protein